MVRLHPVGRPYSVMRSWLVEEERYHGWYVNLEQPWTRTPVGFDSRDDVLDVTVSEDLDECHLKDADELAFTVQVGMFTRAEAETIRAAADTALADVTARRWPFDEAAWNEPLPGHLLQPTTLPAGWDAS
jgi:predicted RNA-binding protein associated with RNAse of E/G family